jgi:hypothetical protein
LPPKVVPRIEKSAVFCAIESVCPLQNAHPRGAKLPPNILIIAINSSIVVSYDLSELVVLIEMGYELRTRREKIKLTEFNEKGIAPRRESELFLVI